MSLTLEVTLPLRLVSTLNERCHWTKRARRAAEQRACVRMSLAAERAWPLRLPVQVTLIRIAPRALDGDNLQGAFKAVRDGIADALGTIGDNDPGVTWRYGQLRNERPRQHAVVIRVEEITEETT